MTHDAATAGSIARRGGPAIALTAIVCKGSGPVLLVLVGGVSLGGSVGVGLVALGVLAGAAAAAVVRRRRGDRQRYAADGRSHEGDSAARADLDEAVSQSVRPDRDAASTPSSRRQIGAIGTVSRGAAGLLAIVVPILSYGVGAWDIGGALIALPLLATALHLSTASGYERYLAERPAASGEPRSARSWFINVTVLVLFLAIAGGMTYITPIDAGAIWLFLGASLLLVAARGDAGCEVLAFANAVAGRRDTTGCVAFAPIDKLTRHRTVSPNSTASQTCTPQHFRTRGPRTGAVSTQLKARR
jgi:hypothetical protein